MADTESLRLLQLVCSRLCHDLVGPAGAVANGLELMADPAMADQALALTRQTSAGLNRRLAFCRRAWGAGAGLTWDEAHEVAAGLLAEGRHTLDWQGAPGDEDPEAARLVLNMLLCLMDATPLGAGLTVGLEDGVRVAAEGEIRNAEALERAVADPGAPLGEIGPREAQPVLTARMAAAAGRRLVLERADDEHAVLVLEYGSGGG